MPFDISFRHLAGLLRSVLLLSPRQVEKGCSFALCFTLRVDYHCHHRVLILCSPEASGWVRDLTVQRHKKRKKEENKNAGNFPRQERTSPPLFGGGGGGGGCQISPCSLIIPNNKKKSHMFGKLFLFLMIIMAIGMLNDLVACLFVCFCFFLIKKNTSDALVGRLNG